VFVLATNLTISAKARHYVVSLEEASGLEADCILALGCLVYPSGRVSELLKDRLHTTAELYNEGASQKILVSGDGSHTGNNETAAMLAFLLEQEVPPEDIFCDPHGYSTYDSARRTRDVFGAKRVVVVTQGFHVQRAVYNLRALGVDAYGVAAEPRWNHGRLMLKNNAREVIARSLAVVTAGIVKPLPVFNDGSTVRLDGDGRGTH